MLLLCIDVIVSDACTAFVAVARHVEGCRGKDAAGGGGYTGVKEKKAGRDRRTEKEKDGRNGKGSLGEQKIKSGLRSEVRQDRKNRKPAVAEMNRAGIRSSEQVYDLFELDAARTLDQNETVAQGMFGEIGTQRFRVCEGPVTRRVGSRESEPVAHQVGFADL